MHHAHIDKFAYQDSPMHRLDSRAKFICVLIFTIAVISVSRYAVSILACYAVVPFAMIVIGGIPFRFVFKHLLIVSPFVVVLALSCPLYNHTAVDYNFGALHFSMTLGWAQFFNIICKFIVTMSALVALVCSTRFADLLAGLEAMGMPRLLAIQLGFLYRYIFLLIDKAHHIIRARTGRTLRYLGIGTEARVAGAMIGSLLVTSIESSERINMAMQARGFDGHFRTINTMRMRGRDWVFIIAFIVFLAVVQSIRLTIEN